MPFAVGFQRWEHLLFLHWEVEPDLIQRRLPKAVSVDSFEGSAYVSILPFRIPESRPLLFPRKLSPLLPGSSLIELNFRTYVRGPGGEPAIWFFSVDASSPAAVAGARLIYRLPYYRAEMSHTIDNENFEFTSVRRNGPPARCAVSYRPSGAAAPATPGTLDHFLAERYVLFAGSGRRLLRAEVEHAPYPLCPAEVGRLEENLIELEGFDSARRLPVNHYAAGLDVKISAPELVRAHI